MNVDIKQLNKNLDYLILNYADDETLNKLKNFNAFPDGSSLYFFNKTTSQTIKIPNQKISTLFSKNYENLKSLIETIVERNRKISSVEVVEKLKERVYLEFTVYLKTTGLLTFKNILNSKNELPDNGYLGEIYFISEDNSLFKKYWPANLHIVGKEIVRFHTIIWPIMLMALDLPLPDKVFGHGWLVINGGKISKSLGNYKDPREYIDAYGVDAVRYFVLREVPFGSDGNFSEEALINRTNGDLANILGNLVNRTIGMANKYFDGVVINTKVNEEVDNKLIEETIGLKDVVENYMNGLEVSKAIASIFDVLRDCNKYIDETMPWVLAKDESKKDRLATVLYNLVECIRICTVLLQAFIPDTCEKIFNQINTDNISYDSTSEFGGYKSGTRVNKAEVLFQRIEN